MAEIETYTQKKTGWPVYRVRWRGPLVDGRRTRPGENFTGPDPADARRRAERFRLDVELAGNDWPDNYVSGVGYISAEHLAELEAVVDAREAAAASATASQPFIPFAQDYVDNLTSISDRTRADYHSYVVNHFATYPALADADMADTSTLTGDDVKNWVTWMTKGERDPANDRAWLRAPRSAKTASNARGLLYSVIQSAIVREHPLRTWNPCTAASLPRTKGKKKIDCDMTVLTPREFEILYWAAHETIRPLLLADVGSGMRFSEITAQWVKDYNPADHATHVWRAWTKTDDGVVIGEPKSEAGYRRIPLDDTTEAAFAQRCRGRALDALTFTARGGGQLRHGNFWNRYFIPAIYRSVRCEEHRALDRETGFLVQGELVRMTNMKDLRIRHLIPCGCEGTSRKVPRFHDLRHTYASWQLEHGTTFWKLSIAMGHESSRTTEDIYAHLMPDHERQQAQAHAAALAGLRLMPSLAAA